MRECFVFASSRNLSVKRVTITITLSLLPELVLARWPNVVTFAARISTHCLSNTRLTLGLSLLVDIDLDIIQQFGPVIPGSLLVGLISADAAEWWITNLNGNYITGYESPLYVSAADQ